MQICYLSKFRFNGLFLITSLIIWGCIDVKIVLNIRFFTPVSLVVGLQLDADTFFVLIAIETLTYTTDMHEHVTYRVGTSPSPWSGYNEVVFWRHLNDSFKVSHPLAPIALRAFQKSRSKFVLTKRKSKNLLLRSNFIYRLVFNNIATAIRK